MLNLTKSKLRKELLGLYFSKPEVAYYVRELARILKTDPTNVSRELSNLESQGLFLIEQKGNQKYYKLNKFHPTFKELKSIIAKTIGTPSVIKEVFGQISGKNLVILYGSVASGKTDNQSDVDVLIVSDKDPEIFYDLIPQLEKRLSREVNITFYSYNEFKRKKRTNDPFLNDIFKNKHEIIFGKL